MEKLDKIMRAEDAAHHQIADARTAAEETLRQAAAEAALIKAEAAREVSEQGKLLADGILAEAHVDVAAIEREATEELDGEVARARKAISSAVAAAMTELAG